MPKAVFQEIYRDLKTRIEQGAFPYQSFLPSEAELTAQYDCSRSSVRRALRQLAEDGYVQSQQGKGVRVIRDPDMEEPHGYDGLETFAEIARRQGFTPRTECLICEQIEADEDISDTTGFPAGSTLTHILRVRYADDAAVGTDESYYLADRVPGLTPEVVNRSVYEYLEGTLGMKIVTSRRTVTVEGVNDSDLAHLALNGFNAVAVVRGNTFDAQGIMVEYTETHQIPGFFSLYETAIRPIR